MTSLSDRGVFWIVGDLRSDVERKGTPIGALDTLIAAHALSLQATLVTNNLREFERVPGLLLDNWVPSV
ncbi:MAG: PIN domain-containing protein [Synechococcaceae cyanobacterium]|nr:PIN domain-containing protein [Synechococcaceae cyanobacterium]